jgi:leucyl-tRNA synthetase
MFVFTTRADTLMGVTFCAVAPEHPLALHAAVANPKLASFIEECKAGGTTEAELAVKEKLGMATGLFVTHPLTGAQLEVWVGNYVLMSYGDGAVMGVPAHDERDFAFALKYQLPIKQVVSVKGQSFNDKAWQDWYATKDGVCVNSGELDGLNFKPAVTQVAELLTAKGLGEKKTTWRLRDWGVSRQRYWGTPIPIIHCEEHGAVPVPEKDLPVVLPQDCIPDGSGNPLHKHEGFHRASLGSDKPVACPTCGKPARRETDTMDTFVDSSWYFMRYCDPSNTQAMVAEGTQYWMRDAQHPTGGSGMDQYIGGIEHAILHLLYARFWTKVMRDLGLVKVDEPFTKLLTQGMVLNHIYSRKGDKGGIEYFWPHEVQDQHDANGKVVGAVLKAAKGNLPAGTSIVYEGVGTMSKSKNNGVDPQDLIERYGADTARLYTMFTAPPEATLEWNDAAVEGSYRFLRRVWNFAHKHEATLKAATAGNLSAAKPRKEAADVRRDMHLVLKQVSYDYERMQYNTVVSGCMKLLNTLEDFKADNSDGDKAVLCEGMSVLLRMLYPACPHISAYLWTELGFALRQGDLLDTAWPEVDEAALVRDQIELMLQVNGKLRGAISVPANASKEDIEQAALSSEAFLKLASGALHQKVIVVPGRLVNIVMAS